MTVRGRERRTTSHPKQHPDGISEEDLAAETGLTLDRPERLIRRLIAENGWPPLIWTRADGYQLGAERAALEAYERAVLTEKLTEFRRFITGTVAPHGAAHPRDK